MTTTPDPRAVEILAARLCAHWLGVGTRHGWPTLDEFGPHIPRYDQIRAEFRATARGHLAAIADSGIRPTRPISDGVSRHAMIVASETVDAVGELAAHCDTLSRRLTAAIGYAVGHLDPDDWPDRVTLDVEATPDRLHAEAARLTDETGDDWGVCAIVRVPAPSGGSLGRYHQHIHEGAVTSEDTAPTNSLESIRRDENELAWRRAGHDIHAYAAAIEERAFNAARRVIVGQRHAVVGGVTYSSPPTGTGTVPSTTEGE